ncbi:MAG: acyltransferase family protein [Candidatus Hermodarchaeota archaeon]
MSDEDLLIEKTQSEHKRYYWIDHARGFIMVLLVITEFLPMAIREASEISRFFLAHPPNQTIVEYMNIYDIGAPAFIFIMGLLMPLSYSHRKERDGVSKAVRHMIVRYGIILVLGLAVILVDHGEMATMVGGVLIIIWDVLPTLGLVGLIALPFLWLKIKLRAVIATFMLVFYQFMLLFGGWREYAIYSIHGGIFGTIFGFSAIMIYATCLGDIMLLNKEYTDKKKYLIYAIVGVIALLAGLLLWLVPGWYPNKRQVTLTYISISLGATILFSFIFIGIDKKLQKPIFILDSYGKSPFIIYAIAIVLEFLISDIIGFEMDILIFIIMIVVMSAIAIFLDKWGKIIKI